MSTILDVGVGIDPIPTGAGGIVRGATVTVNGNASCTSDTIDARGNETIKPAPEAITKVEVQFGSGSFVKATPTGPVNPTTHLPMWTTWTTGARTIVGNSGNTLQITARVTAAASGAPTVQNTATVTVMVDRTPPVLTLTTPGEMTQVVANGKTTFTVMGTAQDPDNLSPVVAVEWAFDAGGEFTLATPKAPGNWSSWTVA